MPTVTVLMTVYNGLPYLFEAIESILNQTYTDFEFLIVDDASTDGSVEVIQSYRDTRIRLVRNSVNLGQAQSLNRGLEEADGDYVARLDQDDRSHPDRLAEQVSAFENKPSLSIVGTWGRRIDGHGKPTGDRRGTVNNRGDFIGQLLVRRCPFLHPSIMFRRWPILEVGGYDPTFAPAEDYELWTRLAAKGMHAFVIPQTLVEFRVHGGQQSCTSVDRQRAQGKRAHLRLVERFCPGESEAASLSQLLRVDPGFLSRSISREEISQVSVALKELIVRTTAILSFTDVEREGLTRVIKKWVGPGAFWGDRFGKCPRPLLRLLYRLFCPFLIPKVRPLGERTVGYFRKLRSTMTAPGWQSR
jgi:hypothetical protein